MVRVSHLPEAKEIKMRVRKFSEINSTFQKNFKVLVDYYNLSMDKIAFDQDMEICHVRNLYNEMYETLSLSLSLILLHILEALTMILHIII